MHSVKRPAPPEALASKLEEWQNEINNECRHEEDDRVRSKIANELWQSKKDKSLLKNELLRTYKECCCYCESKISPSEFGHIEHRLPKSRFPESAFSIDNLHLSCTRCNTSKLEKYDQENEILDACRDEVEQHLEISRDFPGLMAAKSPRGSTTISFCPLNRDELLEARRQALEDGLNLLTNINETGFDSPINARNRNLLELKTAHGQGYCSVYRYIIENDPELAGQIDRANWKT